MRPGEYRLDLTALEREIRALSWQRAADDNVELLVNGAAKIAALVAEVKRQRRQLAMLGRACERQKRERRQLRAILRASRLPHEHGDRTDLARCVLCQHNARIDRALKKGTDRG